MGYPKALLRLGGETFVHRIARILLQAGVSPCIVTLPPGGRGREIGAALDGLEVCLCENRFAAQGLIGSVRTALQEVSPSLLVMAPVDQPFIDADLVRSLISAAAESDGVAVPVSAGRSGHPVVFARPYLRMLGASGADQGAAVVVEAAHRSGCLVRVASPTPLVIEPLNSRDDWDRVERQLADDPWANRSSRRGLSRSA